MNFQLASRRKSCPWEGASSQLGEDTSPLEIGIPRDPRTSPTESPTRGADKQIGNKIVRGGGGGGGYTTPGRIVLLTRRMEEIVWLNRGGNTFTCIYTFIPSIIYRGISIVLKRSASLDVQRRYRIPAESFSLLSFRILMGEVRL